MLFLKKKIKKFIVYFLLIFTLLFTTTKNVANAGIFTGITTVKVVATLLATTGVVVVANNYGDYDEKMEAVVEKFENFLKDTSNGVMYGMELFKEFELARSKALITGKIKMTENLWKAVKSFSKTLKYENITYENSYDDTSMEALFSRFISLDDLTEKNIDFLNDMYNDYKTLENSIIVYAEVNSTFAPSDERSYQMIGVTKASTTKPEIIFTTRNVRMEVNGKWQTLTKKILKVATNGLTKEDLEDSLSGDGFAKKLIIKRNGQANGYLYKETGIIEEYETINNVIGVGSYIKDNVPIDNVKDDSLENVIPIDNLKGLEDLFTQENIEHFDNLNVGSLAIDNITGQDKPLINDLTVDVITNDILEKAATGELTIDDALTVENTGIVITDETGAVVNNPSYDIAKPDTNVYISDLALSFTPNWEEKESYIPQGIASLFPFCIPFDLISAFEVLQSPPEAPYWVVPLNFGSLGTYQIEIDFSRFENLAQIFRILMTLSFIIGLIIITRNIIKG